MSHAQLRDEVAALRTVLARLAARATFLETCLGTVRSDAPPVHGGYHAAVAARELAQRICTVRELTERLEQDTLAPLSYLSAFFDADSPDYGTDLFGGPADRQTARQMRLGRHA